MELSIKLGLIKKVYDSLKEYDFNVSTYKIFQDLNYEDESNIKSIHEINEYITELINNDIPFKIYVDNSYCKIVIIYTNKIVMVKNLYY